MASTPTPLVRPRVILPETGDAAPLDDVVADWLAEYRGPAKTAPSCLEIVGGPGSGKSTALAWLKERYDQLPTFDDLVDADFEPTLGASVPFVCTTRRPHRSPRILSLWLASWGEDEWIEYLLAAHPAACAGVIARLQSMRSTAGLSPRILRRVLDHLAADPTVEGLRPALEAILEELRPELNRWVRSENQDGAELLLPGAFRSLPPELAMLEDPLLQRIYVAKSVVRDLCGVGEKAWACLRRVLSLGQLGEIANEAAAEPACHAQLRELAELGDFGCQSTAVSILHVSGLGWHPPVGRDRLQPLILSDAHLAFCDWPGTNLQGALIERAQLGKANLAGANLDHAQGHAVQMRQANLSGASLSLAYLPNADLAGANLSKATARGQLTTLRDADLSGANLDEVQFESVSFEGANLSEATFRRADLTKCKFNGVELEETDFSMAQLRGAQLRRLDLRRAILRLATLRYASLRESNLSGLVLPGIDLEESDLCGADLSETRWLGANLRKAYLWNTGLAEVDWEGADLRDADLTGAVFHYGSTRSGLVGSPIACEGSKTGFYTDDFDGQHFQAPEEIRKANLCGADLRGAKVAGVDFYLVDLRRARYTADQAAWFKKCGAILVGKKATT